VLYTLFGGIDPSKVLPVLLDVGTDNPALLNDPLYLGWRHSRVKGDDFFHFVDDFVKVVQEKYPKALLQWEDFSKEHAIELLHRYQDRICSFNDDIQGTAATVLSGLYAAVKTLNQSLKGQRIVMVGGGSAGMGIANLIVEAMVKDGLSSKEARSHLYIIDRPGLVHQGIDKFNLGHEEYARPLSEINSWDVKDKVHITLYETVKNAKPTMLIGACAQPNIFTQEMIMEMARHVEKPVIFPLSNPTSKSEANPKDLIEWTKGKALIATGSPFAPFSYNGKNIKISQGNNVYIFPGVGLGAVSVGAKKITTEMFLKAADVLSSFACKKNGGEARLFPSFVELRNVSKEIAIAVATVAIKNNLASVPANSDVEKLVNDTMWYPDYPTYLRAASKFK
ncbi:MAG: oxaloacetate-decarboxylating malate dehydrogenase, partial [Chlamydiales bacterium]|nr:oxaloacetate-decarboxylating malate dehydrogenase [Chlamydiales bacterium]